MKFIRQHLHITTTSTAMQLSVVQGMWMCTSPLSCYLAQQVHIQLHQGVHVCDCLQGPVLHAYAAQHVLLLCQHTAQHEAGCVSQVGLLGGSHVVTQQQQQLSTQTVCRCICKSEAGHTPSHHYM